MQEPSDFQGSSKSWQSPFGKAYSKQQHEELESYFKMDGYPDRKAMEGLAARLNLKVHQVLRWFVRRRAACRPSASGWQRGGFRPLSWSDVAGLRGQQDRPTYRQLVHQQQLTYLLGVQRELLRQIAASAAAQPPPGPPGTPQPCPRHPPHGELGDAAGPRGSPGTPPPCSHHLLLCGGLGDAAGPRGSPCTPPPCSHYLLRGELGDAAGPRGSPRAEDAASPGLPAALDAFGRLSVSDPTP